MLRAAAVEDCRSKFWVVHVYYVEGYRLAQAPDFVVAVFRAMRLPEGVSLQAPSKGSQAAPRIRHSDTQVDN